MKLDLQLTRQTKILLGVLLVALIAAIATQWGPGLYGLISNPKMKSRQDNLQSTIDLVDASKILKPIETELYQETGLAEDGKTTSIFEEGYPESVMREKIDAIVRQAGIPQNYQLNMEAVPGKKSERISPQARRNLIVFSYQDKLEAEKEALNAEIESQFQAENEDGFDDDAMDAFMDAWLDETDAETDQSKETEKTDDEEHTDEENKQDDKKNDEEHTDDKKTDDEEHTDEENKQDDKKTDDEEHTDEENKQDDKKTDDDKEQDDPSETDEKADDNHSNATDTVEEEKMWEFASLPATIPLSIRIELIELIIPIVQQHLVGAEKALFESHFIKTQTVATSGFFGIGAKKPSTEISFRPNSQVFAKFTNLIDTYEENLNKQELTTDMLIYMDTIQSQIDELSQKLQLAPAVFTPESYTVKMKFTAEIDKLVNLNRLIETTHKWLMVRDLQIVADNKQNKVLVEMLLIARVYQ